MTFQQLWAILRARWMVVAGVFLLVVSGVAVFTLLMPKSYTATASVILDIKSVDPIAGMVSPALASPTYLTTQVDVITSNRVALRVVRNLRLNESAEMRQKWMSSTKGAGNYEAWLAALLRGNLEARPSRGSNVINLTYQASDPQFAAAVTNAFVQGYLDTTLELRTAPAKQYNDFFDANARTLRSALEAAQTKLSTFQQKQGILVTDERLDVETTRLNELSTQYVMTQSAVAESGSRQAAANSQGEKSPDVLNNPLVSTLRADLNRQEAQLEQLTTRYGDQHPSVVEAKSGIAETRRKLEAEVRRVTSSVGIGNTVNLSRSAQIKLSLEDQREKVMRLKAVRDEAALLQRDVENAQRAYESVVSRMSGTTLESQANQASISALEYATPPASHSSPRVTTNILLGALVGFALAAAVALGIELFDRRFRTQAEIESLFNQPMIGSIPSFKKLKFAEDMSAKFRIGYSPIKALANKAA